MAGVATPKVRGVPRHRRNLRPTHRCRRLAPVREWELVDEGAVEVGPEKWLGYGFTVRDDGDACRLTGRVLGLTGGNRDVEVYVLGADDYLNWRANPHGAHWRYAGVFSGPRQTATSLDVALPAPGEYHLVVSNRFSVATAVVLPGWRDTA
jgi:hypothetical protein